MSTIIIPVYAIVSVNFHPTIVSLVIAEIKSKGWEVTSQGVTESAGVSLRMQAQFSQYALVFTIYARLNEQLVHLQAENPKQQYLLLKALNEVITSLTAHTTLPDRQQDEVWLSASAVLHIIMGVISTDMQRKTLTDYRLSLARKRLISTDDAVTRSHIHELSTIHTAKGFLLALVLGPADLLDHISIALPQPTQLDACLHCITLQFACTLACSQGQSGQLHGCEAM